MEFDITKYDNTRFSDNDLTHKRIKVLLLWFECEVHKNNLPPKVQINLLSEWIDKLKEEEYYEVIPFFYQKRIDLIDTYRNTNDDIKSIEPVKVTPIVEVDSYLINVKNKIKKWYRLNFKRK